MKLPPELEFHDDLRLLIYRPHGVIDEAAIKKSSVFLKILKPKRRSLSIDSPIHRKLDEVELNFRYVIQVSLHRRLAHAGRTPVKSAIFATDSTLVHYARLLMLLTEGSTDQSAGIWRPQRRRAMARCSARIARSKSRQW